VNNTTPPRYQRQAVTVGQHTAQHHKIFFSIRIDGDIIELMK
jgi:hypothetical protein